MTARRSLTVFAPGSFNPVRSALRDRFRDLRPDVELVFHPPAYSGLLAAQILAGAPADVFVSANRRYVEDLHRAGLVPAPRILAGNRLGLVVRADLAGTVRAVIDLARGGLRLLVRPHTTDPLGQYAAELLDRAGLADAIARKRAAGEVIGELGQLSTLLAHGQVDAAIAYATAVAGLPPSAVPVPLPPSLDLHDRIVFAVGALARDGKSHPAAEPFVDYLLGPVGQRVLERAGFLTLPIRGTWPDAPEG